MCCFGWIGENGVTPFGSVTSQNTFLCGIFLWHLGSVECGHQEERRKSWKHDPNTSAGPSHLSPGIAQWTTTRFWVSFKSGRHLHPSGADPNTKRTTALARTLPWVDDEEVYQLYAVSIAVWKSRDNHGTQRTPRNTILAG